MNKPVRYIHIGFPKSASTSLQKFFFSKHAELYHLGANAGGSTPPYINGEMQTAIEVSLRFEKEAAYDRSATARVFEREFERAAITGKKAVGISSENLSVMLAQDIDTVEKARRLHHIFGEDTRIIFIIREQWSFLKSMYREFVLGGLHLTYDDFVSNAFYNQSYNFFLDMDYASTYSLYCELFGEENVLLIPFECIKMDAKSIMHLIQQHIGVAPLITTLDKANIAASDTHIETMRRLNCVFRVNRSRSAFEPVSAYRFPHYFEHKLKVPMPPSAVEDQQFMRQISQRRNVNLLPYPVEPISYDLSEQMYTMVDHQIKQWNEDLKELTRFDLAACNYSM